MEEEQPQPNFEQRLGYALLFLFCMMELSGFLRERGGGMNGNKTKEQLLMELIEVQDKLGEKVETQDRMIQKFQMLVRNEGLFTQVIHYFPYPIALFTEDGKLKMANQAFFDETKRDPIEVSEGKINILTRLTTENYEILETIHEVFSGETKLLKNLVDPLSMFVKDNGDIPPANYGSAIFFPLVEGDGQIAYGVAMFMKYI